MQILSIVLNPYYDRNYKKDIHEIIKILETKFNQLLEYPWNVIVNN